MQKRKYAKKEVKGEDISSCPIEEYVEKGIFEHLESFYAELIKNYSEVKPRVFTLLDNNSYYSLLYFPSDSTSITHQEINLEYVTLTLSKTKDQPCLCSLYELRYSLKGQRISKKRSCALGCLVIAIKNKIYKLEVDTLKLENKETAVPINTAVEEDDNIKSISAPKTGVSELALEKEIKDAKNRQISELVPGLYSFSNADKSRELLSFRKETL